MANLAEEYAGGNAYFGEIDLTKYKEVVQIDAFTFLLKHESDALEDRTIKMEVFDEVMPYLDGIPYEMFKQLRLLDNKTILERTDAILNLVLQVVKDEKEGLRPFEEVQ